MLCQRLSKECLLTFDRFPSKDKCNQKKIQDSILHRTVIHLALTPPPPPARPPTTTVTNDYARLTFWPRTMTSSVGSSSLTAGHFRSPTHTQAVSGPSQVWGQTAMGKSESRNLFGKKWLPQKWPFKIDWPLVKFVQLVFDPRYVVVIFVPPEATIFSTMRQFAFLWALALVLSPTVSAFSLWVSFQYLLHNGIKISS